MKILVLKLVSREKEGMIETCIPPIAMKIQIQIQVFLFSFSHGTNNVLRTHLIVHCFTSTHIFCVIFILSYVHLLVLHNTM